MVVDCPALLDRPNGIVTAESAGVFADVYVDEKGLARLGWLVVGDEAAFGAPDESVIAQYPVACAGTDSNSLEVEDLGSSGCDDRGDILDGDWSRSWS